MRRRRALAIAALGACVLPALPIALLRQLPPVTTAFMLERLRPFAWGDGACEAIDYEWVPARGISRGVFLAIVAGEDQRFAGHAGFDFDAIQDALEERDAGGPSRGASTISQQVAKNLFLWPGRSWLRKGLEAWLTVWIEALWSKGRILEVYANVAQFGPCTFGVGAASRRFFGRSAAQLTLEQAALLAAVLPDPDHRRPDSPSPRVRARAAWIANQAHRVELP